MENIVICPRCGFRNSIRGNYCNGCGLYLKDIASTLAQANSPAGAAAPNQTNAPAGGALSNQINASAGGTLPNQANTLAGAAVPNQINMPVGAAPQTGMTANIAQTYVQNIPANQIVPKKAPLSKKKKWMIAGIITAAVLITVLCIVGAAHRIRVIRERRAVESARASRYKTEVINTDNTETENEKTGSSGKQEVSERADSKPEEKSGKKSSADSDKVTPEFKKSMDAYEEYFNDYVDAMNKMMNSGDYSTLLLNSSDMLLEYSQMLEAMESIDYENLSSVDYAYYMEVYSRILAKLATLY